MATPTRSLVLMPSMLPSGFVQTDAAQRPGRACSQATGYELTNLVAPRNRRLELRTNPWPSLREGSMQPKLY